MYLPPSRPLCHFWYLMLVASFVMKLSPVCRKLILVIFSSPGSASFPMGSFHILNLGLQLFCFMLSLWDLSQTSTASQSPNLWPYLTMLLPPLSLLVSWAYIVSNSLPNSSAWMSYFTTVTLDVFWNWPHRLCPQSWLLFWTWRPFLDLAFLSLGNVLNHNTIFKFSFFLSTTITYTTNCIHPFAMPLMSPFFSHCWHFGQAFNSQYGVLAHNRDERTGSGAGPPMFWVELYSWLCDFD